MVAPYIEESDNAQHQSELNEDAAYATDTDRHSWAAHYLTAMSKAVVDDAVKVLTRDRASASTAKQASEEKSEA